MLITISGRPGSGKGTIGTMLARRYHCKRYSIGGIRRQLAKTRGMTLAEYNRYGETHPSTDLDIDRWQGRLAEKRGRGIFEGRMSWYFIPRSVKIFLDVSLVEAARRIWNDRHPLRRHESGFTSQTAVLRSLRNRIKSDIKRYRKYYRVNIFNRRNYDLVLDTTRRSPAQVFSAITDYLAGHADVNNQGKTRKLSTSTEKKIKPHISRRKAHRLAVKRQHRRVI